MVALCMYIGISALVFMYAFIGIHTEAIKLMDLLLPFVIFGQKLHQLNVLV